VGLHSSLTSVSRPGDKPTERLSPKYDQFFSVVPNASYIDRAQAVYHYIADIPVDHDPPPYLESTTAPEALLFFYALNSRGSPIGKI
jgi:hypothetical protein